MKKLILLLCFLMLLLSTVKAINYCPNLNASLISYVSMDYNCTKDDKNPNALWTGTVGLIQSNTSILNKSCDFELNSSMRVASSYIISGGYFNPEEPFTFSIWFKMESDTATAFDFIASSLSSSNTKLSDIAYKGSEDDTRFLTYNTVSNLLYSSLNFWDTDWHHIVMSVDTSGKIQRAYLDNVSYGTATVNIIDMSDHNIVCIGCAYILTGGVVNFMDGLLDEAMIFNKVLNITEISQLYGVCNPMIPIPTEVAPSLVLNQGLPSNNSLNYNKTIFYFNGTVQYTTTNDFSCKFYEESINIENKTPSDITINQNFTITDEIESLDYYINCSNSNTTFSIYWNNISNTLPIPNLNLYSGLPNNNSWSNESIGFYYNGTPINTRNDNFECKIYENGINILTQNPSNIENNQNFTITVEVFFYNYSVNCTNTNSTSTIYWQNITLDLPTPPLSLTLNKGLPNDNSQFTSYQNFNYNGSIIGTSDNNFLCMIFENNINILNQSPTNISQHQNFTINYDISRFNYSINCTNTNTSDVINWYNISIDTIEPRITINYPTSGLYIDYTSNWYQSIVINDTNLDGYYVRYYFNNSGVLILQQEFKGIDLDSTYYTLGNLTNASNWCIVPTCSIFLNVTAWDSHNPINKPHEEYTSINNTDNLLRFYFHNDYIELYSDDLKGFTVVDEDNKYKIIFDVKNQFDASIFLRSNNPLIYKKNSIYQAHFIIREILKYIDFVSPDITIKEIQKINDYEYKIKVDFEKKLLKTESIGDLNINQEYLQFYLYEAPSLTLIYLEQLNITAHNINDTATNINDIITTIRGDFQMFIWVILFLTLLIFGLLTHYKIVLIFDSFISVILGYLMFLNENIPIEMQGVYKVVVLLSTVSVFFMLFIYGTIASYISAVNQKKKRESENKDFLRAYLKE